MYKNDLFVTFNADTMFFSGLFALLVDHKLFMTTTRGAYIFEASFTFVNPIECTISNYFYIILKVEWQISHYSASYPLFISFFKNINLTNIIDDLILLAIIQI
jgi:hypothetical protein